MCKISMLEIGEMQVGSAFCSPHIMSAPGARILGGGRTQGGA